MSGIHNVKNIIIKLLLKLIIIICKFIYNFFGMSNFYFLLIGSLPEGINKKLFFKKKIHIF